MGIQYVTKETLEQMKEDLQKWKVWIDLLPARLLQKRAKRATWKNAEYDAAKEAQGILEAKIAALEGALANVRIIDESTIDTSKVSILTKVKLTNLKVKNR